MLVRFCLYGFLKNQRYFEPFFMLALLAHGLSFFWIGVLYACRSLTVNLLEIPSGALADGWGRRGSMVVSFSAYVLSFLTFAFATHWGWFFPAMILFGIGDSFRTGTHKAMIFQWLRLQGREDERTRVYGFTRSWSQFGSATSAVLAAIFVIGTGDYRGIFLFATIPYLLNIVNFLGYPRELDGDHLDEEARHRISVRQVFRETIQTLRTTWRSRPLRRLTAESMAWEGVLNAIKDYLQPVLTVVVIGFVAAGAAPTAARADEVAGSGRDPANVITIAAVYTVLFLLSGWASRFAHRLVARSAGEDRAAARLWWYNLAAYGLLGVFDLLVLPGVVAIAFVALIVLQNLWRPILVSRYDQHCDAARGATVLSIESQAQKLATLVVAPLTGLAVDAVVARGWPGQFWPIALIGVAASAAVIVSRPGNAGTSQPAAAQPHPNPGRQASCPGDRRHR